MGHVNIAQVSRIEKMVCARAREAGRTVLGIFQEWQAAGMAAAGAARE